MTRSLTGDDDGSRHTMTTPGGTKTYGYDAARRMTSLAYGLGTAAWTWLDNNRLSKQTLPNDCYTDYSYNAAGNSISAYSDLIYRGTGYLSTVTSDIPGATGLEGVVDYSYDTKRELAEEESDRDSGYDFANVFDGAGNPTTFRNDDERTYNADNQLTGPGSYVYDGNGNPTTWSGTTLTFDFENRMTAYGSALTCGYRGDGLRAWKDDGSNKTWFLYDGIKIVCELDDDGDLIAESVFGANGLLSRGSVQYQFDPLGDAVQLLDGSGSVTAYRLFDAWGNELTSGSTDPRGYRAQHGYYTDEETGMVALAYRDYAPEAGRFLRRDPVGYGGGAAIYAYVRNSVVTVTDARGLKPPRCGSYTDDLETCFACCDDWVCDALTSVGAGVNAANLTDLLGCAAALKIFPVAPEAVPYVILGCLIAGAFNLLCGYFSWVETLVNYGHCLDDCWVAAGASPPNVWPTVPLPDPIYTPGGPGGIPPIATG